MSQHNAATIAALRPLPYLQTADVFFFRCSGMKVLPLHHVQSPVLSGLQKPGLG